MRYLLSIIFVIATSYGQQSITLTAPAPAGVANVTVTKFGNPGSATYYYWVIPIYVSGQGQVTTNTQVISAPNILSVTNYVRVGWSPNPGPPALTYDVLRTTTNTLPSSCVCAVALGLTALSYNDQGAAPVAYTFTPQGRSTVTMMEDNTSAPFPILTFDQTLGIRGALYLVDPSGVFSSSFNNVLQGVGWFSQYGSLSNPMNPLQLGDYHIYYQDVGIGGGAISAATNGSPAILTSVGHGLTSGHTVAIAGATVGWVGINGSFVVTIPVGSLNTFTIPVDTTAFGPLSGSPRFVRHASYNAFTVTSHQSKGIGNTFNGLYVHAEADGTWTPISAGGIVTNGPIGLNASAASSRGGFVAGALIGAYCGTTLCTSVSGIEVNTTNTIVNSTGKAGIGVIDMSTAALVPGSVSYGLGVGVAAGGIGYAEGLRLIEAVDTGGTLFNAINTKVVATGIDFRGTTFSGYSMRLPGMDVDSVGRVNIYGSYSSTYPTLIVQAGDSDGGGLGLYAAKAGAAVGARNWSIQPNFSGDGRLDFFVSANNGAPATTRAFSFTKEGAFLFVATTQALLGTPANGTIVFCSDCDATCAAGGGTGKFCARENGAWVGF